ncbi:uncharacterized protein LOC144935855 isoform X2 [Lampetra fluviatilis]
MRHERVGSSSICITGTRRIRSISALRGGDGTGHGAAWGCGWWRQERDRHHLDPRSPGPWSGAMGQLCCGCVGETEAEAGGWQSQKSAEDTTLASVSRRVVETAINRAVQQYLRESTTEPRDKLADPAPDPALDPAPPEDNGAVADAVERRVHAN